MKHRKANTALAQLMTARLACALRETGFDTTEDPFPDVLGEFKYPKKTGKPIGAINLQKANENWLNLMTAAGRAPQPLISGARVDLWNEKD